MEAWKVGRIFCQAQSAKISFSFDSKDDLAGRQINRKTILQEEEHTGRQPHKKTTSQEEKFIGK